MYDRFRQYENNPPLRKLDACPPPSPSVKPYRMKTELLHDIIAEKIWDRLPEQDKRFRDIERSIQQRTQDFRRGTGDYLGPKELAAWEDAFARFLPESEQHRFIQESKAHWQAEKEAKEQRQREELEKAKQQVEKERSLREAAVKAQNDAEGARIEAERQKTTAEVNARQARQRTRLAIAFTMLALFLAIISGFLALGFQKQKREIEVKRVEIQEVLNQFKREQAEKTMLQFNNLKARATQILSAGGCPEDIFTEMYESATTHPDSLMIRQQIDSLRQNHTTNCL